MKVAAVCLVLLTLAPTAAAQTNLTAPDAGPEVTAKRVVWGEQEADGSLSILERRRGRVRLLHTVPVPMPGFNGTGRTAFSSFAASDDWTAATIRDTTTFMNGDVGGSATFERPEASRHGDAFGAAVSDCDGAASVAAAADGERLVIAGSNLCGSRGEAITVHLVRGARPSAALARVDTDLEIGDVAIAGPYVAYSFVTLRGDFVSLEILRWRDRRLMRTYSATELGGQPTAFDIDEQGVLAMTVDGCLPSCLLLRGLKAEAARQLNASSLPGQVAIADDRVAYLTESAVALQQLSGSGTRTFGSFGPGRRPLGLDLAGDRLAWSVDFENGTGKVIVRRLG